VGEDPSGGTLTLRLPVHQPVAEVPVIELFLT
jgi:hypothetical protein